MNDKPFVISVRDSRDDSKSRDLVFMSREDLESLQDDYYHDLQHALMFNHVSELNFDFVSHLLTMISKLDLFLSEVSNVDEL